MAETKLGSTIINTNGQIPVPGTQAPDFKLTGNDLEEVTLATYAGKKVVMNIFPSIDTSVCAASVREFNKRAAGLQNTVVLCISKDLPFAMTRFCGEEVLKLVTTLSDFRDPSFGEKYGIVMQDGGLRGLFARAVVVLDEKGMVKHSELVYNIAQEPNYDAALKAIQA